MDKESINWLLGIFLTAYGVYMVYMAAQLYRKNTQQIAHMKKADPSGRLIDRSAVYIWSFAGMMLLAGVYVYFASDVLYAFAFVFVMLSCIMVMLEGKARRRIYLGATSFVYADETLRYRDISEIIDPGKRKPLQVKRFNGETLVITRPLKQDFRLAYSDYELRRKQKKRGNEKN